MNGTPLIDWCNRVAMPVLRAAAAGQPIGYAADQALQSLAHLLGSPSDHDGRRDAERWQSLCAAIDAGSTSIPHLVDALSRGSVSLERMVDTLASRGICQAQGAIASP